MPFVECCKAEDVLAQAKTGAGVLSLENDVVFSIFALASLNHAESFFPFIFSSFSSPVPTFGTCASNCSVVKFCNPLIMLYFTMAAGERSLVLVSRSFGKGQGC